MIETTAYQQATRGRKWRFYAEDFEDDGFYLDANGCEADEDAEPWHGTTGEAEAEAHRRCDLWEEKRRGSISRITYEAC